MFVGVYHDFYFYGIFAVYLKFFLSQFILIKLYYLSNKIIFCHRERKEGREMERDKEIIGCFLKALCI